MTDLIRRIDNYLFATLSGLILAALVVAMRLRDFARGLAGRLGDFARPQAPAGTASTKDGLRALIAAIFSGQGAAVVAVLAGMAGVPIPPDVASAVVTVVVFALDMVRRKLAHGGDDATPPPAVQS